MMLNIVKDVIEWFEELMGYDGKELSKTTSKHTHTTENIVRNVVQNVTDGKGVPQTTQETVETAANYATGILSGGPIGGLVSAWNLLTGGGKAKGDWSVPYDNYPALLHRGEMVLTASQARRYRDGEGGDVNYSALSNAIVGAIRQGLEGAQVNSYLDGKVVTDEVSRILGDNLSARRFA